MKFGSADDRVLGAAHLSAAAAAAREACFETRVSPCEQRAPVVRTRSLRRGSRWSSSPSPPAMLGLSPPGREAVLEPPSPLPGGVFRFDPPTVLGHGDGALASGLGRIVRQCRAGIPPGVKCPPVRSGIVRVWCVAQRRILPVAVASTTRHRRSAWLSDRGWAQLRGS